MLSDVSQTMNSEPRVCSCGHYENRHWTEVITDTFGAWYDGEARTEQFLFLHCNDCDLDMGVHSIG